MHADRQTTFKLSGFCSAVLATLGGGNGCPPGPGQKAGSAPVVPESSQMAPAMNSAEVISCRVAELY